MDKEKQIEELANALYCKQDEYDISNPFGVAKAVYKLGFRKINENEAVISKKKLEKLQRIENIIKRFSTISPTEAEMENKALKETIGIILAQKRNIWKSYNSLKENFDKIKEQARKETARESLEEFICKLINLKLITTTEDFYYELLEVKDDLLKEKYGVDLGEEV